MPKDKEQKKLLREERKQLKLKKRAKFNQLLKSASQLNIQIDLDGNQPKFVDAFNSIWPILQPALEYAQLIRLTGPNVDQVLNTITELGKRISTGQATSDETSQFILKFNTIWGIVSQSLEIIKTFTDVNADEVIDQVLEVGDWIADPAKV